MKKTNYQLLVFDWDGTLFDSTALITRAIQAAVVDVGGKRPSSQQASYVIGLNLMEALAHAAPDVSVDKYPELGQRYRHHYINKQDDIAFFEGIVPLLQALRDAGYKLAVGTGKSRKGLDAVMTREVEAVRLADLFESTRTADQTQGKPHPQMLHELMDEFGVTATETLMIGDTTHDLQMATNAGCDALGVSYGAHSAEDLLSARPLLVVDTVVQLRQFLLK